MIPPRLPEKLATIWQIGTPRFQIAGIAYRPKSHVRRDFAHVDYSNDRTVVIDYLETQIELIEKVGIHNYLQSQMGTASGS